MWLRSKGSLVTAIVALQALVIGLSWLVATEVAGRGVSSRAVARVLDEHGKAISRFGQELAREVEGPLEYGSPSWLRAQELVESFKLPGGATLYVLDDRGRVLAHPALRRNTNLRRVDYSEITLRPLREAGRAEGTPLVALRGAGLAQGYAELMDGRALIAAAYDPALRTTLVVQQPEAVLEAASSRVIGELRRWGALAGLIVLILTAAGSLLLTRRYDTFLIRLSRGLEAEVARRSHRTLVIRDALIFGLARLADHRDAETGGHLERISRYCEVLARAMRHQHHEIDDAWIERLRLASSMHDIGKVGVPDEVLLKPGALLPPERRMMQEHVRIGAETLLAIRERTGDDDLMNMSVQVALYHHERYDGKGYPHGLSGDQIPLAARIVALADIYDALTSKRSYKPALSHEEACRMIVELRGNHLNPSVVDAFLKVRHNFDVIRREPRHEAAKRAPRTASDRAA